VSPAELQQPRQRLVAFAEGMFESLPRADQRRRGETYLRGLLLDGKRKSIQPMAERLRAVGEVQVRDLEQALQQFVNQSPWDPLPARERLARRMTAELAPAAWVVDDTAFAKFGRWSVGVAPQDCGTLGKQANCQVGVTVHAVTDQASCPLDWQLFVPESWDTDAQRRRRAHLPAPVRHRPKWQLALDLLDELAGWGLQAPVVLADAGYGDIGQFRLGLDERGLAWVVQVKGDTSAYGEAVVPETTADSGRGRPPRPRYRQPRRWLHTLVTAAGEQAGSTVAWREGSRGRLRSRVVALRVRPAGVRLRRAARRHGNGELPVRWLLAEWPQGNPSRSSTGWPTCPPTRRCSSWSGWPSCAGESSTTIASSKTRLGWTTSRAAPGAAGTTT
jgi:SRSO17 transposase